MIKTRLPLLLVAVFGMAAAPLAAQSIDVSAANQRVRHAAGNYRDAEIRVHGPNGYSPPQVFTLKM